MSKLPDFIIIGAMKSATSTLHEQLAAQPGIFMSSPKEPNFFSDEPQYAKGMSWYTSLFKDAAVGDLCGESSTHYTKLPTYPKTVTRIWEHIPDVKMIYVMRHPIDRLVSQYIHQWTQRETSIDINQAIQQHPELIAYSQYSQQLEPYFATFGQGKILPVFFERLLHESQEELTRVCQFIGYEGKAVWNWELDAQNVSSQRMQKNSWRDFLVEFPVLKTVRKNLIPQSWRDRIKSLWMMKQKPQINPEQMTYLKALFDKDLEIVGSWLGTELDCDRYKQIVRSRSLNWY
ncbi:sulfotransferase family protein [Merismopedia glauca]|uniref:Sulfotransferase n=1 Tax=Merismopedia glauca CCAP 1448/3 TaxID=1296344 RepID=A0A2T1C499_9CYAN|nr:sulfotransferase [Merismopedia glauca]PSB03071.1 sulfotransferase [Merismopedia glauca CCAP 1448/3]